MRIMTTAADYDRLANYIPSFIWCILFVIYAAHCYDSSGNCRQLRGIWARIPVMVHLYIEYSVGLGGSEVVSMIAPRLHCNIDVCPTQMRNWGVDLPWSLMDEMKPDDDRFAVRLLYVVLRHSSCRSLQHCINLLSPEAIVLIAPCQRRAAFLYGSLL